MTQLQETTHIEQQMNWTNSQLLWASELQQESPSVIWRHKLGLSITVRAFRAETRAAHTVSDSMTHWSMVRLWLWCEGYHLCVKNCTCMYSYQWMSLHLCVCVCVLPTCLCKQQRGRDIHQAQHERERLALKLKLILRLNNTVYGYCHPNSLFTEKLLWCMKLVQVQVKIG